MHSNSVKRLPRFALSAFAAAAATVAVGVLGAMPAADAATGATLALSPASGTDFTTNAATLSWTLPSACVGQEVDVFLYQGTGAWNSAAINTAEGNNGGQQTYYNFVSNAAATAATGSASWPNVASGYQLFGTGAGPAFASTGALVSALGTGLYTVSIACVNNTTFAPITGANGSPIATSRVLVLGATGNSWAQSAAVGTQVALKGVGSAGAHGAVALSATLTASDGTTPAGGVNFYASGSATGTPLNGSTPIKVVGGKALFLGASGYAAGVQGSQAYTAQFVPASPAKYTPSSVTSNVNLIAEAVLIKVTAKVDPTTPTSIDVTANAAGVPTSLASLVPGGGVNVVVDGQTFTAHNGTFPGPFTFNSSGVATATIAGLAAGTHSVTVQLADANDDVLTPDTGDAVLANTVSVTIGS